MPLTAYRSFYRLDSKCFEAIDIRLFERTETQLSDEISFSALGVIHVTVK